MTRHQRYTTATLALLVAASLGGAPQASEAQEATAEPSAPTLSWRERAKARRQARQAVTAVSAPSHDATGAPSSDPAGASPGPTATATAPATAPAPAPAAPVTITQPGDYTDTLPHGGLTRHYRVHVPKSYRPNQPTPLVLALHGGGGDMGIQATDAYYGQITLSEQRGHIVVFPNGYSKFASGHLATWNAGRCCAAARDAQSDDVGFVRALLARLHTQLNVDAKRVFAQGMSNGGMLAYRLACEMPEVFNAVAAVAGTDNTVHCQPSQPISVLHIHALNDERVLFNGGAGQPSARVTEYTSVPNTVAKWVALNGCASPPQRVLNTPGAYCDTYTGCRSGVTVQLCVTTTGGHSWPGGTKPRGGKPGSPALSANTVMADFFFTRPTPNNRPPQP